MVEVKLKRSLKQAWIVLVALIAFIIIPGIRPETSGDDFITLGLARDNLFDFVNWEVSAVIDKLGVQSLDVAKTLEAGHDAKIIGGFFVLITEAETIQLTLNEFYAAEELPDPFLATQPLRAGYADIRTRIAQEQGLVESLIELMITHAIGSVLDYSFPVPPPAIRITELPLMLILSPRDRIERAGTYDLAYGLTVDQQEALETVVENETGLSALVVPLGGLSVYPAMVVETPNTGFIFEVTGHEWTHHLLSVFPLGMNYDSSPELRTMNETTANIIGKELAYAALLEPFPEWAAAYVPVYSQEGEVNELYSPPLAFDFRAEMHLTRIRVDELLAAGEVSEAEAYMEVRRNIFLENGYTIRKLNQAYFAFHGSYADVPGYAGIDPVGPAVTALRAQSPSLSAFLREIRRMNSVVDLFAALEG